MAVHKSESHLAGGGGGVNRLHTDCQQIEVRKGSFEGVTGSHLCGYRDFSLVKV